MAKRKYEPPPPGFKYHVVRRANRKTGEKAVVLLIPV